MILAYALSFTFLLCLSSNKLANIVLLVTVVASALILIARRKNFAEKRFASSALACIFVLSILEFSRGSFEFRAFFVESKIFLLIILLSAVSCSDQLANFLNMCWHSFSKIFLIYSLFAIVISGFSLRFSGSAPISIFPISYGSACAFILLSSKDSFSRCVWSIFMFFSGSLSAVFGLGLSVLLGNYFNGNRSGGRSTSLVIRLAQLVSIASIATYAFLYIADVRGRDIFTLESLDRYMIYTAYFESFFRDASNNWLYFIFGYGPSGGSQFMDYIQDDSFFKWIGSFMVPWQCCRLFTA